MMRFRATRNFQATSAAVRVNCAPPVDCEAQQDLVRQHSAAVLALLSFAMLIVSLDQYIVVVALPEIGRDLGYSSQTLQSVISAYAVASSGFLLLGGRAADLLGRRRMLATGLALYAVASLAGGLATGTEVQLTARAIQGLGGALVFPSTLAVINTTFAEGRDRNHALGIWGGAGAGLRPRRSRGDALRHQRTLVAALKGPKQIRWTVGSQIDFYDQENQVTDAVALAVSHFRSTLGVDRIASAIVPA